MSSSDRKVAERTFFVSYTGEDEDWATWIAESIETVPGWRAILQAWDFVASKSFPREMHQAAKADHTIPVFTPAYFQSKFAQSESFAAWVEDPEGQDARIIPVVVEDCWPEGLLRPIVYIDLVGEQDKGRARGKLLEELRAAILGSRERKAKRFPGATLAAKAGPDGRVRRHRHIYGVGQPTATFVGRSAELERLVQLLGAGDVAVSASIEGLAGIGKTELATKLVYELADQGYFAGGIYWLNAENPDLTAEWARIATGLGFSGGVEEMTAALLQRIAAAEDDVLVILDNVENWSTDLAPGPLPSSHAKILVTSRRQGLGGNRFQHFPLGVLNRDEARALLEVLAGPDIAQAAGFEALLDRLEGHALAVELAGVFLAEMAGEVTVEEYIKLIDTNQSPGEEIKTQTRHGRTVQETLQLLFERASPELRHAWLVFGRLEPEPVSNGLLDACGIDQGGRRHLRSWHLVEPTDHGYRMHRLVREYARAVGSTEEQEKANTAWLQGIVQRASGIDLATGFRAYLPDRSHYDEVMRLRPAGLSERAWGLFQTQVGMAQRSAGMPTAARATLERALVSVQGQFGEDHPNVAACRSNLATVLRDLGDLQGAKKLMEQALASIQAQPGEDQLNVALCRSNLAAVLKDLGDLQGAKKLLEQALASELEQVGEDHPSVASSRSNLAAVLQDLGDLQGAKKLLEQALASELEQVGEDHPSVATCRSNLAAVLQDLGDLHGAKKLLEQALASELEQLGEDHPSVANSRSNLAVVLSGLGDLQGAKELLEQALGSDLRQLGDDHPNVATRRSNLAAVLKDLGDRQGAKKLLEQALASDLRQLGDDHPNVAIRRSNLAAVLKDLGDRQGAKKLLEQALASALEQLGEDHPIVATRRSNLAGLLQDLGDLQGAKKLLEQALASDLERFGKDHPSVARSRARLAMILHNAGNLEEAASLETEVLNWSEQSLGATHPLVAHRATNLMLTLRKLGRLDEARELAITALAVAREQPPGSQVRKYVERNCAWAES